jgi:glycosyltransferase involved in cell wall biosynthesis
VKITIVVPELNSTGGTRVISIYARELKRRGHEVLLVTWKPMPTGLRELVKHCLKRSMGRAGEIERDWYFEDGLIPIKRLGYSRLIRDNSIPDADVVIATWYDTARAVARLAAKKGQKFYFMQDYGAPGQPIEMLRVTWRLPVHFITISESLVELIRQEQPKASITLVPNSVDTKVFRTSARGKQKVPTFGMTYRSLHTKGADIAFAAFQIVKQRHPDSKLLLVGHDSLLRLPPNGAVPFGSVTDEELVRVYASCDAWLFPSRAEGFGLPILEAMACRTPVISTPVGAAPELLAAVGFLVPVDDPEAMADAMSHIVTMSSDEWSQLSNRSYLRAVSWSWSDAVDKFESALLKHSLLTSK